MALTSVESAVQFSASSSVTVTANTTQTSDAFAVNATTYAMAVYVEGDNASGSPSADDYINVYALYSGGDMNTGGNDFDTDSDGQRHYLFTIDTSNDDPSRSSAELRVACTELKIVLEGDHTDGTNNNITCRVRIVERRAAP